MITKQKNVVSLFQRLNIVSYVKISDIHNRCFNHLNIHQFGAFLYNDISKTNLLYAHMLKFKHRSCASAQSDLNAPLLFSASKVYFGFYPKCKASTDQCRV